MGNNQNTNQTSNNTQQNTNTEMPNDENLSTSKEENIKENISDISSDSIEKKETFTSNNEESKKIEEKNIESDTNSKKESDNEDKTKLDESLKDNTNSDTNVNDSSNQENNKKKSNTYLHKIIDYILEKNVFSKLFVIIFATIVFSYAYSHQESITRSALSYIGLILCVIVCYIELLGIRDHIWVIEGSIPTTKQWREAFFTPSTLRKHKIRKMIILLFAFLVFVGIYKLKCFINYREAISFVGIILMVTVVYYEILAVRDEIDLISKFLKQKALEDKSKIEQTEKDESK